MSSALVRQTGYRRNRAWSSSPDLWRKIAIGAGLCAAGITLWSFHSALAGFVQLGLWCVLLIVAGYLLRRGGSRFFGPVLFYDLITLARRGRYFLLRCTYAAMLMLALYVAYSSFLAPIDYKVAGRPFVPGATPVQSMLDVRFSQIAQFAASFFNQFMVLQLLVVVLLTPAYTAGAVAEEKDRRTLEFLLATDLGDREIVLSKLLARFANLVLLILTGLPILSLTELWGGIDPDLLLAGYAATFLTLASVASLSILISVHMHKSRDAILLTYLALLAYVGLSGMLYWMVSPKALAKPALPASVVSILVQEVVNAASIGNPFLIPWRIEEAMKIGKLTLPQVVYPLLVGYAWFHAPIAFLTTYLAVTRLRTLATREHVGRPRRAKTLPKHAWWRPQVGRRPVAWKEIFIEPGFAFNRFGKAIVILIVLASFIPAVWMIVDLYGEFSHLGVLGQPFSHSFWLRVGDRVNSWVRIVGTLVGCLTLLGIAVRAASSVIGERDKDTWDSLMTTPLASREILVGKWLGSVLSVRWGVVWLIFVWTVGIGCGGLYSFAVPWIILCWTVYAAFLATLGLWFSTACRSSLRATLATLAATVICFGAHRFVWQFVRLLLLAPMQLAYLPGGHLHDLDQAIDQVLAFGMCPPVALSWLAFHGDRFQNGYVGAFHNDPISILVGIIGGLIVYGLATWALWTRLVRRFRIVTHRAEWANAAHRAWAKGKKFEVPLMGGRS